MADYQFTISLSTFDASLLPPGSPSKGAEGFSAAVHKFLQEQFAGFKGDARIVVSADAIHVEWTLPSPHHDPIEEAVARLEKREFIPAIAILELLRQHHPTDIRLLYNLGLAYSDLGRLEEARAVLSEAVRLHPDHVNARVALGVTYAKEDRHQDAVAILEEAVAADPSNSWAQRNLGGCLLALGEVDRGTACLLRATELNPKDQQAFLGLAEAYRMAGNLEQADAVYQQVIAIDEYGPHAEQAKRPAFVAVPRDISQARRSDPTRRRDVLPRGDGAFCEAVPGGNPADHLRDRHVGHQGVRGQQPGPEIRAWVDARQVQRSSLALHHVRRLQADRARKHAQLRPGNRIHRGEGDVRAEAEQVKTVWLSTSR